MAKDKLNKLKTTFPDIQITEERGCIVLRGELNSWEDIVYAGTLAVNREKYLGVINDIKLKGYKETIRIPSFVDDSLEGSTPDVLVIGGGVVGCAIARELTKWKLDVMLVDKEYDVAVGASSRNDGCVHVGIDLKPWQSKLRYCTWGNSLFSDMCKDLRVPFERKGHFLIFSTRVERILAPAFKYVARKNGIKGVSYITEKRFKKVETSAPDWCRGAIYMPSGGIVSPYKLTIALAENAVTNGARVCLNTAVLDMDVEEERVVAVKTNRGTIHPRIVINAAGVFADKIAEMAGDRTFTIHPRKGTNFILDKKVGYFVRSSIARSPFSIEKSKNPPKTLRGKIALFMGIVNSKSHTKGGGIVHTMDNNVLVGPNAMETPDREDTTTDINSINMIYSKQVITAQEMKRSDIITYYSGVRAPTYEEDFVVRRGLHCKNIIEAAGIQSPGLTAAPAIAIDVANWAVDTLSKEESVAKNEEYNPVREYTPHLADMMDDDRDEWVKRNPDYGEIICRCEEVSKGEILDALRSPLPVYTVDAVKRRVRPGMGRCQGGFCSPLVMNIISKETGRPLSEIMKGNERSVVLFGESKGGNV